MGWGLIYEGDEYIFERRGREGFAESAEEDKKYKNKTKI
jgi:hypothetical protein